MSQWDCDEIIEGLDNRLQVLRVWDETSISRYNNTGFTASSSSFRIHNGFDGWRSISNRTWMKEFNNIKHGGIKDPGIRDRIISHVTGGWNSWYYTPKESDYISTTASFDWAIWEIVRRLRVVGTREINLAVINWPNYTGSYRGCKLSYWNAPNVIGQGRIESGTIAEKAYRFAHTSDEILFYGRIFQKDVLDNTTWTEYETGFYLPDYFFVPKKWRRGGNWLDKLVWSVDDSFSSAQVKWNTRKEQLRMSRGR